MNDLASEIKARLGLQCEGLEIRPNKSIALYFTDREWHRLNNVAMMARCSQIAAGLGIERLILVYPGGREFDTPIEFWGSPPRRQVSDRSRFGAR